MRDLKVKNIGLESKSIKVYNLNSKMMIERLC